MKKSENFSHFYCIRLACITLLLDVPLEPAQVDKVKILSFVVTLIPRLVKLLDTIVLIHS